MEAKPWQTPAFFIVSPEENAKLTTIDGIQAFIARIISAHQFRRDKWKQEYPSNGAEIDSVIDWRISGMQAIAGCIEDFREDVRGLPNREDQERFFCRTVVFGMTIQSMAIGWILNAAEKGESREKGRKKATQSRKNDWKSLQALAKENLAKVAADPKLDSKEKLYTAAGKLMDPQVKATTFRNYLRGKRR